MNEWTTIVNGEPVMRYIMSWVLAGGDVSTKVGIRLFNGWLESIGLDHNEILEINKGIHTGKLELQKSALDALVRFNMRNNI